MCIVYSKQTLINPGATKNLVGATKNLVKILVKYLEFLADVYSTITSNFVHSC